MKLLLIIGTGIIVIILILINIVNINTNKIYAIILKDDMQFLYNYNNGLSELHIRVISNHTLLDTLLDNEPKKVIASLKGDPAKEYLLILPDKTVKLNNYNGEFIIEYYEVGYNIIPNKLIIKSTDRKEELKIIPLVKENIVGKIILYEVKKIKIDGKELIVEIADNNEKRELGLMFRENLPEKAGMLFMLDKEEKVPFWMKNMRISLDIIWIDSKLRIIDITKNVEPCLNDTNPCTIYKPKEAVKYVLEVKGGFVDKYNIRIGDIIEL